ncbi:TonB-dependent receptor [Betaproteobacteria bacterium PRO4]|uniref:TonB-dependent receptor n=1 Tax=Nitrosomonas sp. TaxID=42353 RepID=UPI002562A7DF|nr:TonB-dependent receptor [Nitrosomonas sp.]MDL1866139.1 TonB-dependent receptor [Betaproteobacteria bacterium PRO4]
MNISRWNQAKVIRKNRFKLHQITWLILLAPISILAQESTVVLGEVTVNSSGNGSLPAGSILTSVDVMGAERVQDKNVMNSWELIGQMPGIQLTEFRLGAESGKPSFRAFNGEGYINGIKLLIDGIPSNVNNGNMRYLDIVFPLDIDYIEVVRGTNDPRYGLHNIGGNISVATRQGGNYSDGRLTYGSFNTWELQAALGRESGGFSQNYFFAKQNSDGYRDHSESRKHSLGGKWFYTSDSGALKTGLIARMYNHKAEEAGYLTAAELEADRFQSLAKNANDHDDRDMQQISGHLDFQITPQLAYSSKLYYNAMKDDRHVTYTSYAAGTAPRQRRLWNEEHTGWMNTLTWQLGKQIIIDGGFNYEHQDNRYRRYRYGYATPTDFSVPAAIANDDSYTFNNFGGYIQAIIRPMESWKIVPAFRTDKFKGHAILNTTGLSYPLQDYGWINQPKISVVYSPNQAFSIYGNWGRTFQIVTGSRNPAYLTPGTSEYKPSINTGIELGVRFRPLKRIEGRIALWQQDATDEIANLPSAGATKNLGETRRRGIDFQVTTHIAEKFKLWFSHSYQEAKIVGGYASGGNSLIGKQVFSTPHHISNAGMEYRFNENLRFDLQGRAQSRYYIDDLNARGKYGGYILFDGGAHYTLTKILGINLQVKNMFNRKYEYVWYDNFFWPAGSYQPMFSPGADRAAYLSLNIKM